MKKLLCLSDDSLVDSEMDIRKVETSIIGKDVWWDTKLQGFRKKRLNLEKVPIKFRCPFCGKIVVKPRDREPLQIRDKRDWKIKSAEIDRLFKIEKPSKSEWDEFVERHKELFEVNIIEIPRNIPSWLLFYGGVCKDCFYDGFGTSGAMGKHLGDKVKERRKKHEKFEKEQIEKYGKEPKYWLDAGFTKNPEYEAWWQRKLEIKRDEKRMKNAKLVESDVVLRVELEE